MSIDFREMSEFGDRLERLREEIPGIMEQLIVGEGVYAVKQARSICKEDWIVNNGTYRMNFHAGNRAITDPGGGAHDGSKVQRTGSTYRIDVYNNLDYAKHLEYGFRSHFVPGHWEGNTFVYQSGWPGGMYVGTYNGFVQGHFTLRRAIRRTKQTQDARLNRKMSKIINARLNGGNSNNAE